MVIAALVTFAILLVAWIVAPSAPRSRPAGKVATSELVEPVPA
jgi:hypothetical protein